MAKARAVLENSNLVENAFGSKFATDIIWVLSISKTGG
jgi:hypothetical protein